MKFIFGMNMLGVVGYILLLSVKNDVVCYFVCFVCMIVVYNGMGFNFVWINVNMVFQYCCVIVIGIMQMVGNFVGIVFGQVYWKSLYVFGYGFFFGVIIVVNILICFYLFYLVCKIKEKK